MNSESLPLISVIVPIYNVEEYLPKCVDSVIGQTYKNLEIILVDDGSPDRCGDICDEYAKKDPRVKVIHKENGGLSSARNAGIDICQGEYISFIDSDDFVAPIFIELLYSGIKRFDSDIATMLHGAIFSDETEEKVQFTERIGDCAMEPVDPREAIRQMLYLQIPNGFPWRLYKRYIFEDLRLPVGWLYEDAATTHRTFMKAKRMTAVGGYAYAYRVRPDSIIRMDFNEKKMVALQVAERIVNDIKAYDTSLLPAAYSRAFAMVYAVYTQVPFSDREDIKKLWRGLLLYRGVVAGDHDRNVRLKNRVAAYCTYLGMNFSYLAGRLNRLVSDRMLAKKCSKQRRE